MIPLATLLVIATSTTTIDPALPAQVRAACEARTYHAPYECRPKRYLYESQILWEKKHDTEKIRADALELKLSAEQERRAMAEAVATAPMEPVTVDCDDGLSSAWPFVGGGILGAVLVGTAWILVTQ